MSTEMADSKHIKYQVLVIGSLNQNNAFGVGRDYILYDLYVESQ